MKIAPVMNNYCMQNVLFTSKYKGKEYDENGFLIPYKEGSEDEMPEENIDDKKQNVYHLIGASVLGATLAALLVFSPPAEESSVQRTIREFEEDLTGHLIDTNKVNNNQTLEDNDSADYTPQVILFESDGTEEIIDNIKEKIFNI